MMKYCERPFNHLYVFPNGDVRLCPWTYECIGNLLESDVEEIFHSEQAEKIRDSIRDNSFWLCNSETCPFCQNDSLEDLDDEEFAKKTLAEPIPTSIDAAYDFVCNHSCPSCRHEVFVPDEEYKKNIKIISHKLIPYVNKAKNFDTNGNGDFFASPSTMEFLEQIRPEKSCEIVLQTNGVFADKAHWDRISHLFENPISITITPNSFDPMTFKYLNGGHDSLNKVIENLHYMKELRKKNIINEFKIVMVVQDTNYMELPSFTERCFNEFEADQVIIRPIYWWFLMTHEEYWFKNIRNPLHPYYKDFKKILEEPILKDSRVYFWGGSNSDTAAEKHPAYFYQNYIQEFGKLLQREDLKTDINEALYKRGSKKVAIYGCNDMAKMLHSILKNTEYAPIAFVDKYAKTELFCDCEVQTLDNFQKDMFDTIIVSNYAYYENIKRDLNFYGFTGKVFPYCDILE